MLSLDLRHLRTTAYRHLLAADRPLPTQQIARLLFGPQRHEMPEASVVVVALLAEDPRFLETHDGRWSARGAAHVCKSLSEVICAVVDLETTGSLIGVDEIIEIGIVVQQGGRVRERFSSLVRSQRRIPPWVENLTGINSSDLKRAPRFTEIAPTLHSLLDGAVFVAHDIRFDLPFLRWTFTSLDLPEPEVTGLCTLCLSRLMWPHLRSRSLNDLARHFRLPHLRPHRADQDANATAGVLQQAFKQARRHGLNSLGDLFQVTDRHRTQAGTALLQARVAE